MRSDDISTGEAMRALHVPAFDSHSLDRRHFLRLIGAGAVAGVVGGVGASAGSGILERLGLDASSAFAAAPTGDVPGILLVIGMYGGNDGLNTVVPFDDGAYYDQHGALAIPGEQTLAIDAHTGLHPDLSVLKRFWDADQLAIVEGVGYPNPNFSHFSSMATWMSASLDVGPGTGWLGRWLDEELGGRKDLLVAAEIGHEVPLHLVGSTQSATAVPIGKPQFGASGDERFIAIENSLRDLSSGAPGTWLERIEQTSTDQIDLARRMAPLLPSEEQLGDRRLAAKLEVAARLINANLGFRVFNASLGDFDSHAEQPDQHPALMRELNTGLDRFFELLDPAWAGRVTVMTFSEFGRTSWFNDGLGTDHGSAAPHFVLGAGVRGGKYGQAPSLSGLARWDRMRHHVDFRDYYGTVIDGWLGGDATAIVSGYHENLGFFDGGPSSAPTVPGSVSGNFVAMNPARVFDTRDGTGGRSVAIGPGETVRVPIAGVAGVPAGVKAVAINVTAIRPSETTFVTAFPSGLPLPATATLNPRPGAVVPNMSIVGVGSDGRVSLYNDRGHVHVSVDLMGYFQTAAAAQMVSLSPRRILDTRRGVGGPTSPLRPGAPRQLKVLGKGGVPSLGVDAVVVNLTAVGASTNGWITAWPSGDGRPNVANLTYRAGEVVPNMVICKVGSGGSISFDASSGEVDVVGDVVGYYASSGSALSPVAPQRVLDTRDGTGAPRRRLGARSEIELVVGGRSGVPAHATAVVLNVTGIRATSQTFLTVYPTGEARPTTASLNPGAGSVAGNLVLAKLGSGGSVTIFNDAGDLDLTADVTGYFV